MKLVGTLKRVMGKPSYVIIILVSILVSVLIMENCTQSQTKNHRLTSRNQYFAGYLHHIPDSILAIALEISSYIDKDSYSLDDTIKLMVVLKNVSFDTLKVFHTNPGHVATIVEDENSEEIWNSWKRPNPFCAPPSTRIEVVPGDSVIYNYNYNCKTFKLNKEGKYRINSCLKSVCSNKDEFYFVD